MCVSRPSGVQRTGVHLPFDSLRAVLSIDRATHQAMLAHAIGALPLEACGLIAGDPSDADGRVTRFYPW